MAPSPSIPPDDSSVRAELVEQLQDAVCRLERSGPVAREGVVRSGCQALDRLLPEGGLLPGTLVEWLAAPAASGVLSLALQAAREAMREGGALVVLDRKQRFYPPAAVALGIELEQLVVVRAANETDELWALDQALRCPGVAAAWAELDVLDWRWFRRLQLAAEDGGGLGLLQRPIHVRGQPTWAGVQLLVEPRASEGMRRIRVEILRCRGGRGGGVVELEMDDVTGALRESGPERKANSEHETHSLHLASQLAHPTARRRSARA